METAKKLIAKCNTPCTPVKSTADLKGASIWTKISPFGSEVGGARVKRELINDNIDAGDDVKIRWDELHEEYYERRYSRRDSGRGLVGDEESVGGRSSRYYDGKHGRRDRDDSRRYYNSRRHDDSG